MIPQAALEALADEPDVSIAEIAGRAGVVRATIYAHFSTCESLLNASRLSQGRWRTRR